MTVKEMITKLKDMPQDVPVIIMHMNGDGCGTCGYGATIDEIEINYVSDFESRVVLGG